MVRYDQTISYWAYVWVAVACVAGPVFGLAGAWLRRREPGPHVTGLALTGGVFVAEGIVRLLTLAGNAPVAGTMIAVGALVPPLFGRGARAKLSGLVALTPAAALGLLGFTVLDRLTP